VTWEYKTLRLEQGDGSETWGQQSARWSRELTVLGMEGWEVCYWEFPWVALKRRWKKALPSSLTKGSSRPPI
jgi:hypothetical protein